MKKSQSPVTNGIKKLLFPFLLLCMAQMVVAQGRTVTGTISSAEDNSPVPGLNVVEKGTTNGTVTNMDGFYSITVTGDVTLVFSYVGMITQEVYVGESTEINLVMEPDYARLDEVVVVGYGTVKKSDLTGSVVSFPSEEIVKAGTLTMEESIQGRMAGVQVRSNDATPGGGMSIKIRGGSSLTAGNQPLYVIDGFPITPGQDVSDNPMVNLNPADIESLEVLKDASATAIYGANGANGVIIITTKQGNSYNEEPIVNVTGFYQYNQISEQVNIIPPGNWAAFNSEYYYNDWNYVGSDAWSTVPGNVGTNYLEKYTRPGQLGQINASIRNATGKGLRYFASASYHKEAPVLVNSDFERFTGNVRLNQKIGKLDLGINLYYGQTTKDGFVHDDYTISGSMFTKLANLRPFAGVDMRPFFLPFIDDPDAVGESDDPFQDQPGAENFEDFDAVFYEGVNLNVRRDFRSHFTATYEITDWLSLGADYGFTLGLVNMEEFAPASTQTGKHGPNGFGRIRNRNNNSDFFNARASFNKQFNQHNLNAIALVERRTNGYRWFEQTAADFESELMKTSNFLVANIVGNPSIWEGNATMLSYVGRVNYGYAGRYLLTVSYRADGSSKFSENNKWGFFPSVAGAWKISEESFMSSVNLISNLKLRAGWGQSGNSQIGFYPSYDELIIGKTPFEGIVVTTAETKAEQANDQVKWETNEQINIGIDFGMFRNRLNITADVYNKLTKDLLLQNQLPTTSGFRYKTENVGSIRNKGFEIAISSVNISRPNFVWRTDFNWSMNRSEVLDLGEKEALWFTATLANGTANNVLVRVGDRVGNIYGYILDGVFNSPSEVTNSPVHDEDQIGFQKYVDINRDGRLTAADQVVIGNTEPDFYGGMINNFEYKSFDFSFAMRWSWGNDVINGNIFRFMSPRNFSTQVGPVVNNIYTDRIPWNSYNTYKNASKDGITHSEMVEDGSYLKVDRITFGYRYQFKKTKLGIRIFATVKNPFWVERYSWPDPEVSVYGGSNAQTLSQVAPGIDIGAYPRIRSYQFGINVDL